MTDRDPEEFLFEDWDTEEPEETGPIGPAWRRPVLIAVAAVTAVALAVVPIVGYFQPPPVADNGLEICGFDYCVVQDAVAAAGYDDTMVRLSRTFVSEEDAVALARRLTDFLDESPVEVVVVERLDGRLGGVYDAAERTVYIESPVSVWTLIHEVAHAAASGHGEAFQRVIVELAALFDQPA